MMFSSPINFLYYHVHAASSGQSWGKLSINLYLSPTPANIPGGFCHKSGGSLALWPWEISWLTLFAGGRTMLMSAHVFSDSRWTRLIFTCNNGHWFLISWADQAGSSFSWLTHFIFTLQTSLHSLVLTSLSLKFCSAGIESVNVTLTGTALNDA